MPNPKTGTVTVGHRPRRQGNQGRQGRVPRRQDRDHPRADRQGLVPGAEPDRQRARARRQRRQGEAVGGEGQVPAQRDHVLDDGAGHHDRHGARSGRGETLMAVTRAVKEEELLVSRAVLQEHGQRHRRRLQGAEGPGSDGAAPPGARRQGPVQGRQEHAGAARAEGHELRAADGVLLRHDGGGVQRRRIRWPWPRC